MPTSSGQSPLKNYVVLSSTRATRLNLTTILGLGLNNLDSTIPTVIDSPSTRKWVEAAKFHIPNMSGHQPVAGTGNHTTGKETPWSWEGSLQASRSWRGDSPPSENTDTSFQSLAGSSQVDSELHLASPTQFHQVPIGFVLGERQGGIRFTLFSSDDHSGPTLIAGAFADVLLSWSKQIIEHEKAQKGQ